MKFVPDRCQSTSGIYLGLFIFYTVVKPKSFLVFKVFKMSTMSTLPIRVLITIFAALMIPLSGLMTSKTIHAHIPYARISAALLWSWSCTLCKGLECVEGLEHLKAFMSMPGGVLVFNHPTFMEPFILLKELRVPIRFLFKEQFAKFALVKMCLQNLGGIPVKSGQGGTVNAIADAVKARRAFDSVIGIAPAAGQSTTDQYVLADFKSGAFVTAMCCLPVVIKYAPYERWLNEDSVGTAALNRMLGNPIEYVLKVLPPMTRGSNESVGDFKSRVKAAMEQSLLNLNSVCELQKQTNQEKSKAKKEPRQYPGSRMLLFTSIMFGVIGVSAILNDKIVFGLGMIITCLTSVVYHWSGNKTARKVDYYSNLVLGTIFSLCCAFAGHYMFVLCAIYAAYQHWRLEKRGHKSPFDHFALIHIPVIIGFIYIALLC